MKNQETGIKFILMTKKVTKHKVCGEKQRDEIAHALKTVLILNSDVATTNSRQLPI